MEIIYTISISVFIILGVYLFCKLLIMIISNPSQVKQNKIIENIDIPIISQTKPLEILRNIDNSIVSPTSTPEIQNTEIPITTSEIQNTEIPITTPEIQNTYIPITTPEIQNTEIPITTPEIQNTYIPITTSEIQNTYIPITTSEIQNTYIPITTQEIQNTYIPITTQEIQNTEIPITTPEIRNTEIPITTPEIQNTVKFAAGNAGITDSNYETAGGGGAGGIIVAGYSPNANIAHTSRHYGAGGFNGVGFGSGGGGGGNWKGLSSQKGGSGNKGFVYIVEDDNLITKSGVYKTNKKGNYTFILMGGGGAGGGFTSINSGGSSGRVEGFKINIKDRKNIRIKIGSGGKQATTVFRAEDGSPTILTIDNKEYKALGGLAGGNIIMNNPYIRNYSLGGNPRQNGEQINSLLIDYLNS